MKEFINGIMEAVGIGLVGLCGIGLITIVWFKIALWVVNLGAV